MAQATVTLKLPFYRLNQAKQALLANATKLNLDVANQVLALPKKERKLLTSKNFIAVDLGSVWVNQAIRNANAATKVKQFKSLPLETNNQNWAVHKTGDTYSISFAGLTRGRGKRIPVAVHQSSQARLLDAVIEGKAVKGSIKLWRSRKGIWYVLLSVSMEVPDPNETTRWIGVDRGQNHLAVASTPEGTPQFWTFGRVRQIRKHYANKRRRLQKAGKRKTVKRLECKERRTIQHINHVISKEVIAFAKKHQCGIRLEDLSGIRQSRQRKKTKSDASQNRDFWPFYQLEQYIMYKAELAGIKVEKVPAAYTSKTCCKCGGLGKRNRHAFNCGRCGYQGHSDHNASRNISGWVGLSCSVEFQIRQSGLHDTAPSQVISFAERTGISHHTAQAVGG